MDFAHLQRLVARGESDKLELKKTTGQLPKAGKTLCGFLNGAGGILLIGVAPDGSIHGQLVADGTLRDLAAMLREFEPQPSVQVRRLLVPGTVREVIILEADPRADLMPFTYEGRAYERTGTTVTPMSQKRYEELLLNRMHSRHRWENNEADGLGLGDLDAEEILRTASFGLTSGRMPEVTSSDPAEILDRLGLRVNGRMLNAAVVAFVGSCSRTFLNASSGWRASRGSTRPSSWISGNFMDMLFGFLKKPSSSCGAISPPPAGFNRGFSRGPTSLCSRSKRCARPWSTLFATGITRIRVAP